MEKNRRIFVIISATLLMFLFVLILGSKVFNKYIVKLSDDPAESSDTIDIDWEKMYPYHTKIELVEVSENTKKEDTFLDKYYERINKFQNIGSKWVKQFYWYNDLAKVGYVINAKLTDFSGKDDYVKLNNGYWIARSNAELSLINCEKAVAPYASLNNYLKNMGIDFIYFYAPHKECSIDDEYPAGVDSYTNANMDSYMRAMELLDLEYVDMRKNIHDSGMDHYSMFYKTDHHWTVQSGIWAADVMADEISKRTGISMRKASEIGTYRTVTYEKAEFGSYGRAVTHYVADSEDFTIFLPEFDTNYRLEIPDRQIDVTGKFDEIFIDYDLLNEIVCNGGDSVYRSILYGNSPYQRITNLDNPDGPKILMIKDSFAIAVVPYLAGACSEILMLDTRSEQGGFNGSVVNCINEENPDIVLALQWSPQSIKLNK